MAPGARALARWIAALAAAALALAATALAAASPAPPGDRIDALRLAVDASGRAVAAWAHADDGRSPFRVRTADLGPAGWAPPADRTPLDEGASAVHLAGSAAGDLVLAWQRDLARGAPVCVATRTAAGEWSAPAELAAAGSLAGTPRGAVGADGTAVVAWEAGGTRLMAAVRRPGGGWGPARIVSGPDAPDLRWAAPVVGADGSALLAWTSGPPGQRAVIVAAMPAGGPGVFADPKPLSAPDDVSEAPAAALAPDGSALVAWRRTMPDGVARETLVAERAPAGSWSAPAAIGAGAGVPVPPAVAVDAAGHRRVVWPDPAAVRAAERAPGGQWAVRTLSEAIGAGAPALVAGPQGSVIALWTEGARHRAAAAAPGGPFGEPADVTPGEAAGATSAVVGVDGAGGLVAVWRAGDADQVVRAARRPAGGAWGPSVVISRDASPQPRATDGGAPPPPAARPEAPGKGSRPPRAGRPPDRITLSVRQLRINQRIAQAALRRVRALEARLAGRPAPRRRPARAGTIRLTRAQLVVNQRIAQAALRRVARLEARLEGRRPPARRRRAEADRITLTARQLRIDQRIAQAALRRVAALEEGLAGR